jgi:SAM-dependent methyltransferase
MSQPNESERQHWNDPRWSSLWPKRERLTSEVTSFLLRHARLQPGERVLDVGSGGGGTSFEAGVAVGTSGVVVGADLSLPLVELARRRGLERGALNVTFESLDMQIQPVPGRPFDIAISQFGVMFFDDPVTAFRNIRDQLQKLGRLAFACWQEPAGNPWLVRPVLAPFQPAPPQPPAGVVAPGPFAFADPAYVTGILEAAGFTDVARTPYEVSVDAPADAVIDEDQVAASGVPPERQVEAQAALDAHMRQFEQGDGLSRFPLAFQVFEARVR